MKRTLNHIQKLIAFALVLMFSPVWADDNGGAPAGDGTTPPAAPPAQPPAGYIAASAATAMVEAARKEEKDKLYKELEALKNQVKSMTEANSLYLQQISDRDNKLAEAEKQVKKLEDTSKSTKDEQVQALTTKVAELEGALSAKDAEHAAALLKTEIANHRENLLAKYGTEIIPELVSGNTKDEITTSVVAARERFFAIKGTKTDGQGNPVVDPNATTPPAGGQAPPAGAVPNPASGVMGAMSTEQTESLMKELNSLNPIFPDDAKRYAEIRKQLKLK